MISEIHIEDYLRISATMPLIDVRSPAEFNKGHIPGAHSVPVFSDKERANVGRVYVKQSKEDAIKLAWDYINPKLKLFIEQAKEIAPQQKIAIHCWRGGMRSRAFAQHLSDNGFLEVYVINGGYKAYRNHIHEAFNREAKLIILGGYTGSGKTQILKFIRENGLQVIDLEGLANHKGSVFGGIGAVLQPSVEQFENNLFAQWNNMDFSKPMLMEDESHKIGSVEIPINLYRRMGKSALLFIRISKEERAKHLVVEYAGCDKKELISAIQKVSKRLGDLNARTAVDFLEKENYYEVAMLLLAYYDKSYNEMLSLKEKELVFPISLPNINHKENAKMIRGFIEKMNF